MTVPLKQLIRNGMAQISDALQEVTEDTGLLIPDAEPDTLAGQLAAVQGGNAAAVTEHIIPAVWFSANIEDERIRGVVGAPNRIADFKLLINVERAAAAAGMTADALIAATRSETVLRRVSENQNYEVIEQKVGLTKNQITLRVIGQT